MFVPWTNCINGAACVGAPSNGSNKGNHSFRLIKPYFRKDENAKRSCLCIDCAVEQFVRPEAFTEIADASSVLKQRSAAFWPTVNEHELRRRFGSISSNQVASNSRAERYNRTMMRVTGGDDPDSNPIDKETGLPLYMSSDEMRAYMIERRRLTDAFTPIVTSTEVDSDPWTPVRTAYSNAHESMIAFLSKISSKCTSSVESSISPLSLAVMISGAVSSGNHVFVDSESLGGRDVVDQAIALAGLMMRATGEWMLIDDKKSHHIKLFPRASSAFHLRSDFSHGPGERFHMKIIEMTHGSTIDSDIMKTLTAEKSNFRSYRQKSSKGARAVFIGINRRVIPEDLGIIIAGDTIGTLDSHPSILKSPLDLPDSERGQQAAKAIRYCLAVNPTEVLSVAEANEIATVRTASLNEKLQRQAISEPKAFERLSSKMKDEVKLWAEHMGTIDSLACLLHIFEHSLNEYFSLAEEERWALPSIESMLSRWESLAESASTGIDSKGNPASVLIGSELKNLYQSAVKHTHKAMQHERERLLIEPFFVRTNLWR